MSRGRRFTEAEDALIRKLAREGLTRDRIARSLGRPHSSTSTRIYRMGLTVTSGHTPAKDGDAGTSYLNGDGIDWRAMAWDRLAWRHGADHADRVHAGKDPRTQSDLKAWRELGRRSAA